MHHEVSVGVFDWGHFGLTGGYYPDDLPAEWRLAYFANDFDSACLRLASYNRQQGLLEEMLDDLPERFDLSWLIDRQVDFGLIETALGADPFSLILVDQPEMDAALAIDGGVHLMTLDQLQRADPPCAPCGLLPPDDDLRLTRAAVEQWMQPCFDRPAGRRNLWLAAAQTSPQQLSEVRLLVEMLGF
jgi:hypothetical protein